MLVLVVAVLATRAILGSRPEPEISPDAPAEAPRVEAVPLAATRYRPVIRGRGTVRPTRQSALVSEIAGAVVELSDDFVTGGAFRAGDVLIRIDERDSTIALTRARASLARAEAQFEEQAALAEQAVLEWRQLGRRGEPSSLTLREPQLAAARAERDAAAAELERAELDLERTRIEAPYDGLVLERAVDPGQFVTLGTRLGRVHASDVLEVVVPLGARQFERLALPGEGRGAGAELVADGGGRADRWRGFLVRVERVDPLTQQLDVLVRVPAPLADPAAPLRVGQQVRVAIEGRELRDVFVVPRAALRESGEVVLVDAEDTLRRRAVDVAWTDAETVAIDGGLAAGERLVITPMSSVADGTPVRVMEIDADDVLTDDGKSGDAATDGGGTDGASTEDLGTGDARMNGIEAGEVDSSDADPGNSGSDGDA